MSQAALEDAVITQLNADQGAGTLYAAVGGRIYLNQGPDSADETLVVARVIVDSPDRYFSGKPDVDAEIQIDIFGGEEDMSLQTINTKLFTQMDNKTLTMTGHTAQCWCIDRGSADVSDRRMTIQTRWRVVATLTS